MTAELMQLLPNFGARALVAVQRIDTSKSVYIRIRTGPRRSQMRSVGRVELVAGESFEMVEMMREVERVIADGGSHQQHVVELMEYDPNGRATDQLHTVWVPPTLEDRTAESDAHLENGDTVKALASALVSMAQSADARADRVAAQNIDLMDRVADHRVNETQLAHQVQVGAPAADSRMQSMALFMSMIGPMLPHIKKRMEDDHARKTGAPTPTPEPTPEPTDIYESATEGEVADAMLASLSDLSTADPSIWDDPERKATAMSLFLRMQAAQAEAETESEGAPEEDPDLTPDA